MPGARRASLWTDLKGDGVNGGKVGGPKEAVKSRMDLAVSQSESPLGIVVKWKPLVWVRLNQCDLVFESQIP